MISTAKVQNNILKAILTVCDKEAEKIKNDILRDYSGINGVSGRADVSSSVKQYAKDQLILSIFGFGQKAVIGEYGRGSEMDRDNPALKEYITEDLFNKARLKKDFAILTRPYEESYQDLDGRTIKRKPPAREYNLEKTGDKRFAPVKPKYIVREAVNQRLPMLLTNLAVEIAAECEVEKLFDGLRFEVKL